MLLNCKKKLIIIIIHAFPNQLNLYQYYLNKIHELPSFLFHQSMYSYPKGLFSQQKLQFLLHHFNKKIKNSYRQKNKENVCSLFLISIFLDFVLA